MMAAKSTGLVSLPFSSATDFEQELLREIATLPKEHHAAVLVFVRYLKYREVSRKFTVAPEELLRMCIEEIARRPHEDFQRAIEYVLEKNKELYKRVA